MPKTDAQKRAEKKYYEKNRERLAAYKSEYWLANKHRWRSPKTESIKSIKPIDSIEPEPTSD